MKRPLLAGLMSAIVLAAAVPCAANDSAAELAAGGLVLVKTDAIALQREDLVLSPSEVRVRYEMRNDTGRPVTLRVAFPMPEVPSNSPDGLTVGGGNYNNIAMKTPTDPNFMGFRVWVQGRELRPEVEVRAELPDGRDIAAALREIGGVKLVMQPGLFDQSDKKTLDAETRRKLTALGAFEQLNATTWRLPWTTRVTFHWEQTFAPGITVVEHTYRPVLGFRFIVIDGNQPLKGSGGEEPAQAFCIDQATDGAIHDIYRRLNAGKTSADAQPLSGYTLGYILRTANNWRGPIGTFHLTLEGGQVMFDDRPHGETRVTSLCTDLPLSRTGAQRFEATVRDYAPKQDLRVLYIAE